MDDFNWVSNKIQAPSLNWTIGVQKTEDGTVLSEAGSIDEVVDSQGDYHVQGSCGWLRVSYDPSIQNPSKPIDTKGENYRSFVDFDPDTGEMKIKAGKSIIVYAQSPDFEGKGEISLRIDTDSDVVGVSGYTYSKNKRYRKQSLSVTVTNNSVSDSDIGLHITVSPHDNETPIVFAGLVSMEIKTA